jgi:hypothetical protein
MSYLVIGLSVLVVSALTLFSGFGPGMLLTAFAVFFPVEVAVAATAVFWPDGISAEAFVGTSAFIGFLVVWRALRPMP